MKSVMISIQPRWCEKIANGNKTIEVRKTKPKLEIPFKCYIYCTKGKPLLLKRKCYSEKYCGETCIDTIAKSDIDIYNKDYVCQGKVIGEFVCDKINKLEQCDIFYGMDEISNSEIEELSCVDIDSLLAYKGDRQYIYGWHISDLKIYDEPKKISEFALTRPPQNWCYAEIEKSKNCFVEYDWRE